MPNPTAAGLPNPASYDSRTAGVLLDNVTGLMWEQTLATRAASAGCVSINGDVLCTQAQAVAYCAANRLAGYADWRLPSVLELVSTVDYTKTGAPTIDASFTNSPTIPIWSSTLIAGNAGNAWVVYLGNASTTGSTVTNINEVRCVRTATPNPARCYAPGSRFQVQPDTTTVRDLATGINWQRMSAGTMSMPAAQAYCSSLGAGFRLPSVNELQTLVDYAVAPPAPLIDPTFTSTPASAFWSSSFVAGQTANAWYVAFYNGDTNTSATSVAYQVRCLR